MLVDQATFPGTSLDTSAWSVYGPNGQLWHSTQDAGWWTSSAVSVAGGELRLTGSIRSDGSRQGGALLWHGANNDALHLGGRWTFRFKYDTGAGYGCALLLWPDIDAGWPTHGEIDILEMGTDGQRQGANANFHLDTVVGSSRHANFPINGVDFSQWHDVAVEWVPTSYIAIFIDGVQMARETDVSYIPSDRPMRLTFQQEFIGSTPPVSTPVVMHISNTAFYRLGP